MSKTEEEKKAEAQSKVELFNTERLNSFCPIIKNTCRADCVCFSPGGLKWQNGNWYPTAPSCTHISIEGVLPVEVYN